MKPVPDNTSGCNPEDYNLFYGFGHLGRVCNIYFALEGVMDEFILILKKV